MQPGCGIPVLNRGEAIKHAGRLQARLPDLDPHSQFIQPRSGSQVFAGPLLFAVS